jgi:hypothetical protein
MTTTTGMKSLTVAVGLAICPLGAAAYSGGTYADSAMQALQLPTGFAALVWGTVLALTVLCLLAQGWMLWRQRREAPACAAEPVAREASRPLADPRRALPQRRRPGRDRLRKPRQAQRRTVRALPRPRGGSRSRGRS